MKLLWTGSFYKFTQNCFIYKFGKTETSKADYFIRNFELESEKADYGEVVDEIEIEYEGESFQIGFNSRYLLDVLSVLESKNVKLECKNSMSPTIIKSPDDESFLSVIMPLRVEW